MSREVWLVNSTLKYLTRLLCRVDDRSLALIPDRGPLIMVTNHINFLDVPLLYTHLQPRPLTGFAKIETWDNPLLKPLADLWQAIPIRRGEVDLHAMRCALQGLVAGKILCIAPEGTRSGNGRLRRGSPGVVMLAQMSGAPILPVAFYGNELFQRNIRRLRRTDFYVRIGSPLRLKTGSGRVGREMRQHITDEIMYQVAALLPPQYRGVYSDGNVPPMQYLENI